VTKFVVDISRALSHIQADVALQPSGTYATEERYVRFGDVLLGRMDASGAFYIHRDHLGSVREVSDAAGSFVASVDYAPYGTPLVSEDEEYLFAGERFDAVGLLSQNRARWLDSKLGGFVSVDMYDGETSAPDTLQRYRYVGNDPVNFIDPTGFYQGPLSPAPPSILSTVSTIVTNAGRTMAQFAIPRAYLGAGILLSIGGDTPAASSDSRRRSRRGLPIVFVGERHKKTGVPHSESRDHVADTQLNKIWHSALTISETSHKRGWWTRPDLQSHANNGCKRGGSPSRHCDEYPFASTREGGEAGFRAGNVSLRLISGRDNTSAGNLVHQLKKECSRQLKRSAGKFLVVPVYGVDSDVHCGSL